MRRIALSVIAATLVLAPVASAHAGTDHLTIVAKDSGCASGESFCFEVTEGSLANVSAGDEVEITFKNEGSSVHNLYVAELSDADPDRKDTPEDVAIASTDDLDGGEETTLSFTAPDGADGLYLWCDVSGHEQLGMWTDAPYSGGSAETSGSSDDAQKGSPGAGLIGVAIAGLGAALLFRRR